MKVVFTPRARRHLQIIANHIGKRNPEAAIRVGMRIREAIDLLASFPTMGRKGTVPDTRELVISGLPFIAVYRLNPSQDVLTILGVYHGAQLRPGQLGSGNDE